MTRQYIGGISVVGDRNLACGWLKIYVKEHFYNKKIKCAARLAWEVLPSLTAEAVAEALLATDTNYDPAIH